jgi:hypothetical protein
MPSTKIQTEAIKLRTIRFKYAAAVATHARTIAAAAKALCLIETNIRKESIAIAGEDYEVEHETSFDTNKSMDHQFENRGEITGPGFNDILAYANEVEADAADVAAAPEAPPLPFE